MPEPLKLEVKEAVVSQQKPWDRLDNEPARWFFRFRRYLSAGHTRSVNAIFEAERREKEVKSRGKIGESWYNAAKMYRWAERATAYDEEVEKQKAQAMRALAARSVFVSSAYRIWQLSSLAEGISRVIEAGQKPEIFLPLCRQLQAIMHDIADELAASPLDMATICDAAGLDAAVAKLARLNAQSAPKG